MSCKIKEIYNKNKSAVIFISAFLAGIVTLGNNLSEIENYIEKYNPLSEENRDPPINIGMKIIDAEKILGQPQDINFIARSYFSYGIELNPDYEHSENIGGITVKKLPSGVSYKGKINGIHLNSSFDQIKEDNGHPTYWGVDSPESSVAIWYKNDLLTIVQFKPDKDKIWIADSITYTKAASMVAYRAILTSVFQELKAGRVSIFAEELDELGKDKGFEENNLGMLSLDSFVKQYLYQEYDFLTMRPALGGGVELYLLFNKKKVLYFWIYPLGWEQPSLRAIVDLDKFNENYEKISKHNK